MSEPTSPPSCSASPAAECCALEAVVSVDERGQLVLPKELRTKAGIGAGERLAVVSYRNGSGEICCITLVKANAVADAVKSVIEPVIANQATGRTERRR